MDVLLVMFKANGKRHDFPVKKAITILGRGHGCGLRIPLSSVSREHCQVELRDDGVWLSDLGSSNGTFYNGNRIIETKLDAGDAFTLGPVHFTVVIDGNPSSVDPVRSVLEDDEPAAAVKEGKSSPSFASDDKEDSSTLSLDDELMGPTDIGEDFGVAVPKEKAGGELKFLDEDDDILSLDDDEDESPRKPAPAPKKPAAPPPQLDDSDDFDLLADDEPEELPKAKINVEVTAPKPAPTVKEKAEQSDTIPFDDLEDLGGALAVDDEESATAKTISLSAEETGGMLAEAGLLDDEAALNLGKNTPAKPDKPTAKAPPKVAEDDEINFGAAADGESEDDPLSALENMSKGGVDDSDAFDLLMGDGEQEDMGGFVLDDEDDSK